MGAPARSHMKYGCFTQNNFFNTQAELIRETSIILNTRHLYMENYFAFGNHISYGCTQAPPFYGNVTRDVLFNIIMHIFIYCLIKDNIALIMLLFFIIK